MNLPKDLQNIVDGYLEEVPTYKEKYYKSKLMWQLKWCDCRSMYLLKDSAYFNLHPSDFEYTGDFLEKKLERINRYMKPMSCI